MRLEREYILNLVESKCQTELAIKLNINNYKKFENIFMIFDNLQTLARASRAKYHTVQLGFLVTLTQNNTISVGFFL